MKRSFMGLALTALFLVVALPALAHEDHCTEIGGVTDDEGRCIQHAALEITVDYPMEASHISDALTAAMDEIIASSFDDIVGWFSEGFQPVPVPGWTLIMEHEILDGPGTVSVVFSRYSYTGGANGIAEYLTVSATIVGGDLLTLPDLFLEGVDPYATLQPLAAAALTEQFGEAAVTDFIETGTAPTPENYADWALTTDSLMLYFDEYQVAPGAAGPQAIALPLSALADVLQPQYLP